VVKFGEGVYAGDEVPPDDVIGPFGQANAFGSKNPKIELDNGKVAWGCECWWAPVEYLKKRFATFEWQDADIEAYRRKANEAWNAIEADEDEP